MSISARLFSDPVTIQLFSFLCWTGWGECSNLCWLERTLLLLLAWLLKLFSWGNLLVSIFLFYSFGDSAFLFCIKEITSIFLNAGGACTKRGSERMLTAFWWGLNFIWSGIELLIDCLLEFRFNLVFIWMLHFKS